ncbi:MAG: aminotransferase class I/II-fold pyridoxal phosphate-dependent enzyme [Candidatus Tectomicrobia bacterium]|nr:aminotransferase class I/II-fold pyridoxal phosphate-dependent enzyme [Candidatus Tectomicrobia bacterium]
MRFAAPDILRWFCFEQAAAVSYDLAKSDAPTPNLAELGIETPPLRLRPGAVGGAGELRAALGARYGVGAEEVVVSLGASMTNFLVFAALLEPGDVALVEEPAYDPLVAVPRALGAGVRRFPRPRAAGYQPDLEALAAAAPGCKLIVLTNLHNPSGAALGGDRLAAIAEIARRAGAWVLCDEAYRRFQPALPPLARFGPHCLSVDTLTKVWGLSSLRVGWVVAAAPLCRSIVEAAMVCHVSNPAPTEEVALTLLAHADRLDAWSRSALERNRRLALEFLARQPGLSCYRPEAGPIFFPYLPGNAPARPFVQRLAAAYDTRVVPGDVFGEPTAFRLSCGGETPMLEEGLRRLAQCLREERGAALPQP